MGCAALCVGTPRGERKAVAPEARADALRASAHPVDLAFWPGLRLAADAARPGVIGVAGQVEAVTPGVFLDQTPILAVHAGDETVPIEVRGGEAEIELVAALVTYRLTDAGIDAVDQIRGAMAGGFPDSQTLGRQGLDAAGQQDGDQKAEGAGHGVW